MWIVPVIVMVLAAVFGFSLVLHYFLYQTRMDAWWRWLGGVAGGAVAAVVFAVAALFVTWPPQNNMVVFLVGLLFAGQMTSMVISTDEVREEEKGEVI